MVKEEQGKEGRNESVVLNWVPLNLEPGLRIMLQCPRTKRFNIPGKVVQVREGGRSAWVDVGGGKTYLRNRRYMRRDKAYLPPEEEAASLLVDLGVSAQLRSILKRLGHSKKRGRKGLMPKVRFQKEEREEEKEGERGVYVGACHEGSSVCFSL